ncbi:MAG: hypothetical protein LUC95_04485 [Lachnospiraceae bacterium]|nr:hypothetical protein [Lachnospiraceae bacterium]
MKLINIITKDKGRGNQHGYRSANVYTGSSSDSETVYITNTGSKYHRGSCRYLKKSKIAISKADAIAQGYDACSVCNP